MVKGEGPRHQVGHIPAHQGINIDGVGQELVELLSERGHTRAQHRRVERHIDPRDHYERLRVPGGSLQRLKPRQGAGHRVLLAGNVVVDDLQVFAAGAGHTRNIVHDLVGGNTNHVGAQGPQTVVGAPLLVAGHQRVHGGATRVHNVDHRFEIEDVTQRRERGVLPEGMPGVHAVRGQGISRPQAFGLPIGHHGQRNLGELGEVQHALGVAECHLSHGELRGIIVDDLHDGEPQVGTGVAVRPLPGGAGSRAGLPIPGTHPLGLNALAGVNVGDQWVGEQCLPPGHHLPTDTAGDLQGGAEPYPAHPLHGDFYLVAQLHHPVHGVGPAGDSAHPARYLLGGGR